MSRAAPLNIPTGNVTIERRAQYFQHARRYSDTSTKIMNRVTRKIYVFPEAFQLSGMDHKQRAGRYEVKCEDEPIGDVMYSAYRRVSTLLFLPPAEGASGVGLFIETTPAELAAVADEE